MCRDLLCSEYLVQFLPRLKMIAPLKYIQFPTHNRPITIVFECCSAILGTLEYICLSVCLSVYLSVCLRDDWRARGHITIQLLRSIMS